MKIRNRLYCLFTGLTLVISCGGPSRVVSGTSDWKPEEQSQNKKILTAFSNGLGEFVLFSDNVLDKNASLGKTCYALGELSGRVLMMQKYGVALETKEQRKFSFTSTGKITDELDKAKSYCEAENFAFPGAVKPKDFAALRNAVIKARQIASEAQTSVKKILKETK